MNLAPDRVICVPLSEQEWQAFIRLQPEPVAWLQQAIRERLNDASSVRPADTKLTARPDSLGV